MGAKLWTEIELLSLTKLRKNILPPRNLLNQQKIDAYVHTYFDTAFIGFSKANFQANVLDVIELPCWWLYCGFFIPFFVHIARPIKS